MCLDVETTFSEIIKYFSDVVVPKWAGGGGVAFLAFIAFQFWNAWRKDSTERLQIGINQKQKQEEQEVNEFKEVLAAKDQFIKEIQETLRGVQETLKSAYAENDTLRKIFNADRDQWTKEKAVLVKANAELISHNQALMADNVALRHQIELLQGRP